MGSPKEYEKLFKSNHSSQTTSGLTFLKMAERSFSDFTYKVPGLVIATNWGEATLRTNGSFLIKVLAKSKGPVSSDSEAKLVSQMTMYDDNFMMSLLSYTRNSRYY